MNYISINGDTLDLSKLRLLQNINIWLDNEITTDIGFVIDKDSIKTIFCLKRGFSYYYTDRDLSYATVEKERNKGYCTYGIEKVFNDINNNPSLRYIQVVSVCDYTDKFCIKNNLEYLGNKVYRYKNPNFDEKYNILQNMIFSGNKYEDLLKYCNNDSYMISILNRWYKQYKLDFEDEDFLWFRSEIDGEITEGYSK